MQGKPHISKQGQLSQDRNVIDNYPRKDFLLNGLMSTAKSVLSRAQNLTSFYFISTLKYSICLECIWKSTWHCISVYMRLLLRFWQYFSSLKTFQGSFISWFKLISLFTSWICVSKLTTWRWKKSVISSQDFVHSFFFSQWCLTTKCNPSTSDFNLSCFIVNFFNL